MGRADGRDYKVVLRGGGVFVMYHNTMLSCVYNLAGELRVGWIGDGIGK